MSYVKSPVELGLVTDTTGIYVMTEETWIDAMVSTSFLQFGIGDAPEATIAERQLSLSSSKNVSWQKHLLDTIPEPGYRDHALHKIVRQSIAAQLPRPDSNRHSELFKIAVEKYLIEDFVKSKDFEPIRVWLNEKIRKCAAKLNPDHVKQAVNLRGVQDQVIKKVLSALRQNGVVTNFVCELAARIGKTILFLSLAKTMREEFGHESMFIMAYGVGLSVKTSYKDEIGKYIDFACMTFIDAADADSEEQYKQAIAEGKMPVVFISLNPEVEEKYEWINQLQGTHIALLEETDFGTHTDSQVEKVEYILANKTVTRINASGTNIGRLAKAFGKNAIDEIISVPYCMVEQDPSIPNVVVRRFYNMLFNPKMNKLLEDFDKDVLPNINKILEKARSQEKFIAAVFQDLLGYQPIYGMNLSQAAGEIINNLMLFVNISKKAMEALAEIIEKHCAEHKVLILNGDYTDNKEAEGLTKEELVRLQNGYYEGRDKLLVITNMMGTRSYSIPEIQACLFMQEGGDVYPYMQKYSRCLTPGYGKKFGHIFDFAFDQSKTRNTVMSVAVEAALLIRQKGITYPDAVRTVMNSVNIKDMVSGQWIDGDEVIKQFEDNNKLLEIANSRSKMTLDDLVNLAPNLVEALGELAKRSSSNKAEKSKIDKIIKTGKTFDAGTTENGRSKKNPLAVILDKAKRAINGSATTVLALSNYQGESFLECLDIIGNNAEMQKEFIELYGVDTTTIKTLADEDCLPIPELDIIVKMSKYNNKQKHIENNALAILKDDPKLWFDIFGNRELKRFIKSKHCKRILVVAGGHGSEIDVLVDMFGVDIVDKIVYNDKYSFLCNQIKRKYPGVTVMQGDFTELEFDMEFDVVVGNPPFKNGNETGGKSSLWRKIVSKAWTIVKDNGTLIMVTPQFPNSANDLGHIFTENQTNTVWTKISHHFPGIGSSFFAWSVTKTPKSTDTLFINDNIRLDVTSTALPNDLRSISILQKVLANTKFECKSSPEYLHTSVADGKDDDHLFSKPTKKHPYIIRRTSGDNYQMYGAVKPTDYDLPKVVMTFSGNPHYKYHSNKDPIGTIKFQSGHILVKNATEGGNLIKLYESALYRYIQSQMSSGGMRGKNFYELPKMDLTRTWSDKELFDHFGLTEEEVSLVTGSI